MLREVGYSQRTIAAIVDLVPLGIITHPSEVGGYPRYGGAPHPDSDHDGLPDAWERKHGLNCREPADAVRDDDGDGYTNIEEFINGTDPQRFLDYTRLENNSDPLD